MSDNSGIYLATFDAMLKELGRLTTERSELLATREAADVRIKQLQTAVEGLRPLTITAQPNLVPTPPSDVRLHCSCGAAVTEEEYQVHRARGCDNGVPCGGKSAPTAQGDIGEEK